jgi:hypothetical protein
VQSFCAYSTQAGCTHNSTAIYCRTTVRALPAISLSRPCCFDLLIYSPSVSMLSCYHQSYTTPAACLLTSVVCHTAAYTCAHLQSQLTRLFDAVDTKVGRAISVLTQSTAAASSTTSSSVFTQDSILGRIMRFIGKRTACKAACAVVCKRWNTFAAPYSRVSRMPQLAKSTATANGTAASVAAVSSSAAGLQPSTEASAAAAADSSKGNARPKSKPKTKASKQRKRNGSSK